MTRPQTDAHAETKQKKQRGRPFKKGQSGNPAGRPRGSSCRATILLERMLADDGADVVKAVIAAAKGGDMQAAKMIIDRLVPTPRGRRVLIDLPVIKTAEDVLEALTATVTAMGDGELAPDEAATVAGVIEVKRRAIETVDLERRITAIEEAKTGR